MGARGWSFAGNRWIAKMERAVSPRPRPPLVPPAITVAVHRVSPTCLSNSKSSVGTEDHGAHMGIGISTGAGWARNAFDFPF